MCRCVFDTMQIADHDQLKNGMVHMIKEDLRLPEYPEFWLSFHLTPLACIQSFKSFPFIPVNTYVPRLDCFAN